MATRTEVLRIAGPAPARGARRAGARLLPSGGGAGAAGAGRAAAGRSRAALRAGELRRARRPAEPGGGEHHHHHQRRRGRRRHAAGAAARLAVRGLLPRLHGAPGRRAAPAAALERARLGLHHLGRRLHRHQQPRDRERRRDRGRALPRRRRSRRRSSAATPAPTSRSSRSRATTPLPFVEFGDSDAAQGRRLGARHRQPARPGLLGLRRHRLGAQPHAAGQLRRLHPDRRRDQPRQLRRAALRHERAGDRGEHRDPLAQRRLDRHRLRDVVGGGRPASSTSSATSARPAAAGSACASRTSTRTWPTPSASTEAKGALVTDVPEGPALKAGHEVGRRGAELRRRGDRRHPRAGAHRRRHPRRARRSRSWCSATAPRRRSRSRSACSRRRRWPPRPAQPPADAPAAREESVLGMTVAVINDELRQRFALDRDVTRPHRHRARRQPPTPTPRACARAT